MLMGFGLDVPYTKPSGAVVVGQPSASKDGKCGDSFALQQMLADLGFFSGTVNGQIGNDTFTAIRLFSESAGVSYAKGTFPQATVCQAIMAAWSAKMTPAVPVQTTPVATSPISVPATSSGKMALYLPKGLLTSAVPKQGTATSPGGLSSWWTNSPMYAKAAVVGVGVALVGGIAYVATRKKRATPNRRRK